MTGTPRNEECWWWDESITCLGCGKHLTVDEKVFLNSGAWFKGPQGGRSERIYS
jgi:hypothetical protein